MTVGLLPQFQLFPRLPRTLLPILAMALLTTLRDVPKTAGGFKKSQTHTLHETNIAPETLGLEDAFPFWEGILTCGVLVLGSVICSNPAELRLDMLNSTILKWCLYKLQ